MDEFKFQKKLSLAASYESLENYLHAIQIYTSLIEEDESYIETYLRFIKLYERTGRTEEAVKVVDKMITLNPKKDYALITSVEFYMQYSFWEKAAEVLSALDAADYPFIDYWRGLCYYNLKNYDAARFPLEYYYKNSDVDDLATQVLLLLVKVEFELCNFEVALEYAKKFEYLDSHNWEINLLFANIYFELDMLTHAVIKIEKAFRRKKRKPEIMETAAKIYFRSGEYDKAEKYFDLLLESTDEISAEVYSYIAAIAKERKEFDKAQLYYELALKIDPGFQTAMNALNYLSSQKTGRVSNE